MISDRVCRKCGVELFRVLGDTGKHIRCKECGERNYIGLQEVDLCQLRVKGIGIVVVAEEIAAEGVEPRQISFTVNCDPYENDSVFNFANTEMRSCDPSEAILVLLQETLETCD